MTKKVIAFIPKAGDFIQITSTSVVDDDIFVGDILEVQEISNKSHEWCPRDCSLSCFTKGFMIMVFGKRGTPLFGVPFPLCKYQFIESTETAFDEFDKNIKNGQLSRKSKWK